MMPPSTAETAARPKVLLAHHLRQLKLPTVLREYEKVALEAAREGQDHIRYLLRLVELELIDRERRFGPTTPLYKKVRSIFKKFVKFDSDRFETIVSPSSMHTEVEEVKSILEALQSGIATKLGRGAP